MSFDLTALLPQQSTLNSSQFGNKRHTKAPTAVLNNEQKVYLVVFGYPPDKFTFTSNYFADLGGDTEPETNTEIVNCFRIGFSDPTAAARAVRKNGELLQGSFMIGVKWAVCTPHLSNSPPVSSSFRTSFKATPSSASYPDAAVPPEMPMA